MQPQDRPQKTAAARAYLSQQPGQHGAPVAQPILTRAQRMLLITVDGQRSESELLSLARSLGLDAAVLRQLETLGLISRPNASEQAQQRERAAEQDRRTRMLAAAKLFALELASRMLVGQDGRLREQMRAVQSESAFWDWLAQCESSITLVADAERAALFRHRVAANLPRP
ncbi:hypothetical protein [Paucibacter sp. KCTC 42545]|uniref:hypothetical protein n=1 Tax=Paucibacter sp. KCTC 42545 TaxID=1768242 RepID=UPI000733A2C4|nr:hypothetical protein [Paucibacter sp. KCTC 42545]ALT76562.1 hypothetical protein AT984_04510 [Paucibacter sp. KCTC 42545]